MLARRGAAGEESFSDRYLSGTDRATDSSRSEGLRAALRELGYIEGQNITIDYRYAEGRPDRQPELAAELVRLKVDLIVVAGGDGVIRPAMNSTKTIPIVLTGFGSDPVRAGFIESLAQPGGNVTGLTSLARELGGKRLELLKEAVPKLARVAVLYQPSVPGTAREVKEDLPVAARALGLTVQPWELRDAESFEKVFAALRGPARWTLFTGRRHADTHSPQTDRRLYVEASYSVARYLQRSCGSRGAHVLWAGCYGHQLARRLLRR